MNICLYCGKETTNKNYCSRLCQRKALGKASAYREHKGHKCWSVGLTKETDERVRKAAEKRKGRMPYNKLLRKIIYCKNCNKELCVKVTSKQQYCSFKCSREGIKGRSNIKNSKNMIKKWQDPIYKEEMKEKQKNSWTEERRFNMSEISKERWQEPGYKKRHGEIIKEKCKDEGYLKIHAEITKNLWKDEAYRNKHINDFKRKPTKPELILDISLQRFLPGTWRYTGDGKFWVTCADNKRMNPDYKQNGERKVIEYCGFYTYTSEIIANRIKRWNSVGYKCLAITYDDLFKNTNETFRKIFEFSKE